MLVFAQGHLYVVVMVKMERSSVVLKPSYRLSRVQVVFPHGIQCCSTIYHEDAHYPTASICTPSITLPSCMKQMSMFVARMTEAVVGAVGYGRI